MYALYQLQYWLRYNVCAQLITRILHVSTIPYTQ